MTSKRFLVSLSFAGENRKFVEEVSEYLIDRLGEDKVFYDNNFKHELARPNLDNYLMDIYQEQSQLIAVFLCENYDKKEWCGVEWSVIRDLIKRKRGDGIMPFRFDDGIVEGFLSIHGFIDVRAHTPKEVSEFILKRLKIPVKIRKARTKRAHVDFVLDRNFDSYTQDEETPIYEALKKLFKSADVTLKYRRKGSVILGFEIPEDQVGILTQYVREGYFSAYGLRQLKIEGKVVYNTMLVNIFDGLYFFLRVFLRGLLIDLQNPRAKEVSPETAVKLSKVISWAIDNIGYPLRKSENKRIQRALEHLRSMQGSLLRMFDPSGRHQFYMGSFQSSTIMLNSLMRKYHQEIVETGIKIDLTEIMDLIAMISEDPDFKYLKRTFNGIRQVYRRKVNN